MNINNDMQIRPPSHLFIYLFFGGRGGGATYNTGTNFLLTKTRQLA